MGLRCFIAINLHEPLKKEIDESTAGLKKDDWDVRWVPVQNLHITLKFLGNTPEDLLQKIEEKLSRASAYCKPFDVKLCSVGVFPDEKRPRVIWIDLLDSDELVRLQEGIENSMVDLGFEKEGRPFSPHLTIGRIRSLKGRDSLLRAIRTLKDREFGNIRVDRVSLMRSELKPTGAQYTIMAEFKLG
ncbi:MAG: RNA 2',3'-cyclic phosphodiesterase [Thermodesulfovibrionales bacterium]